MSFSSDLWDSAEKIQKEFYIKFHELKVITEVFKHLSRAELSFSDQIMKICSLNKSTGANSVGNSIRHFFIFLENVSHFYKNHANTLSDWIITPTEKFVEEQLTATNQLFEEVMQKERYIALKLSSLESFQKEYHQFAKMLAHSAIKVELAIARNDIDSDEMKIRMELQHKCLTNLSISKMSYINYLGKFNEYRENHNARIKADLNTLQSNYVDIIGFFKWAFLTSEIYFKALLKDLKEQNKKASTAFQTINPSSDLQKFIESNRSTAFPLQRYEFIPYKLDIAILNQLNIPNHVKENLKEFIKEEAKYVQPKKDSYTNDSVKIIEDFVQSSWNSEIDHITKTFIIGLLKESKFYRTILLAIINTFRPKGMFIVTEATYALLIELLSVVLTSCIIDSDYETIKSVIIISQTFFKNESEAKEKVDLQAGLLDHPIFHRRDIWEGIIKHSINEELSKKKESPLMNDKKLKNLTIVIVMTHTFNMETFGVSNDIIKEITDYFCKLYQISEDMLSYKKKPKKLQLNSSNEEIAQEKGKIQEEDIKIDLDPLDINNKDDKPKAIAENKRQLNSIGEDKKDNDSKTQSNNI